MEDILLKLGFKETYYGFELSNVKDNSIMCKIFEVESEKFKNKDNYYKMTNYINNLLEEKPVIDFIRVMINDDTFSIFSEKYNSSKTTKILPISYFLPIFAELLKEKRDSKLNNLLKK